MQHEQLLPRAALAFDDAQTEIEEATRCIAKGGRWRPRMVAAVSLLSTISDILRKVEVKQSDAHSECIKPWWKALLSSKPEPHIWWDFIHEDRGLILHEYAFRVERHPPEPILGRDGERIMGRDNEAILTRERFIITKGYFEGQDGRHLLRESSHWWRVQLNDLEACIRSKHPHHNTP